MKKTLYALMRTANVQGMTTAFSLEPDRLGPQVRKNAVRMLRDGFVHGRGNAANIALHMAGALDADIPHNYYGESIVLDSNPYTADGSNQIIEKMRACITAELLTEDSHWRRERLKDDLAKAGEMFINRNYLRFYGMEIPAVREFLAPHIRQDVRDRLEQAAQMLLSSTAIHIETYRSN